VSDPRRVNFILSFRRLVVENAGDNARSPSESREYAHSRRVARDSAGDRITRLVREEKGEEEEDSRAGLFATLFPPSQQFSFTWHRFYRAL